MPPCSDGSPARQGLSCLPAYPAQGGEGVPIPGGAEQTCQCVDVISRAWWLPHMAGVFLACQEVCTKGANPRCFIQMQSRNL